MLRRNLGMMEVVGAALHPHAGVGRPPCTPGPVAFPTPYAPMMHGFGVERLRPPNLPPVSPASGHRLPPPPLVPMSAFAGAHVLSDPRFPVQAGPPMPALMFTQEDVDMVLYGYARNKAAAQVPGHALSGLRTGELSYGIDRILGGLGNFHPSMKPPLPGPIDTSTLDLPEGIELFQTTFASAVHYGVFCKKTVIPKGTQFGPFQGRQVNTSEIKTYDDNTHMWEIFQDGKLSHFVDGRGSAGNWMAFVNCARYAQEQNLIAIQVNDGIVYEACKDIPQGTELLVWYGDSYLQFMGIPVALKEMAHECSQQEEENSQGYQCERCGKVFAYKYYRDKHLKYTRCVDLGNRKFPCHLCTRSFEKRDRLRIHILHVHEKHRPHKCTVCDKSFSQSSSLNKHMRVHSGERPYKCVYCSKAFTASSILRTHIRQHSGEKPFKCRHCGKAFASHAAHDSHVRRTHTKERPCICDVCGKAFAQAYELKFHMNMHTGDHSFSCETCGKDPLACSCKLLLSPGSDISFLSGRSDRIAPPSSETRLSFHHDINMNSKLMDEIDVVGIDADEIGCDANIGILAS